MTLQGSIRLMDGFSTPMKAVISTADRAARAFHTLERASAAPVNTAALGGAAGAAQNVRQSVDGTARAVKSAEQNQRAFNKQLLTGNQHAGGLALALRRLVSVTGALWLGRSILETSDSLSGLEARLKLVLPAGADAAAAMETLRAAADRSRASFADFAGSAVKMLMNSGGAFKSLDAASRFTELLGKSFLIDNADAQTVAAATKQITQAIASGVFRGDEFNSFMENAPTAAGKLAQYLGKSIGELRKMAEEGKLLPQHLVNGLFASGDLIDEMAESMPKTFADAWRKIKDGAAAAFAPVFDKLSDFANSDAFQRGISAVTGLAAALATALMKAYNGFVDIYDYVRENWTKIEPILTSVLAAVVAIKAILVAAEGLNAVKTALTALFSPIGIVFLALAGLVYLLLTFPEQILGGLYAIGGYFKHIGAMLRQVSLFFEDLGAVAAQVFEGISGAAAALKENIATAFENAFITAAQKLHTFVATFLTGVKTIADALNNLPGIDLDTSGLSRGITTHAHKAAVLENSKGAYQDIAAAFARPFEENTLPIRNLLRRFRIANNITNENWWEESWKKGHEAGAELREDIDKFWGGLMEDLNGLFAGPGSGDPGGNGNGNSDSKYLVEIAGNTADIRDALEITEEDLKYLRDIAERDVVNRYTTARVSVIQNNTNSLSDGADIDGVIRRLNAGLREAVAIAAEGDHN
ncbi:MAG: tape measure protein [Oscillospiraceae bacterium]|nr:tape measure protein [Oscillospiraceae bacterium]